MRFRLSMVIGFVILLAVMATSLYAASSGFTREVNQKRSLLEGAGSVFAAVLAEPVAAGSSQETAKALRGIRNMSGVTQADVRDSNGDMLTQFGSGAILIGRDDAENTGSIAGLWAAKQLRVDIPIVNGGEQVGTLGLLADISDLHAAVWDQLWATAMVAAMAILIGVLLSQWLIAHLTRPLRQLSSMMESFGGDQASELPQIKAGQDETGVLANAFNTMITSIRERDARIANHVETLEETVAERTHDLSIARDNAEAANAAKSDFLATMSHEIRTPMNGMLVMAEMLSGANLPARQRRYAEIISRSGESLLNIINDILDLSKIESGKLELEMRPVSLDDLLCDVATLFWERAREKKIALATYVSPDVPDEIMADPTRLNQVITNLVNNALKFTETGGVTVRVLAAPEATAGQTEISLEVEDTGIGIPEDKIEHIFEAFSQADQTTTRRFGGTGLGLAVCRRLADAMGGTIRVRSTEGRGSVFTLCFPAETVTAGTPPIKSGLKVNLGIDHAEMRATLAVSLSDLGAELVETGADICIASSRQIETMPAPACPIAVFTDIGDTGADALLQDGRAADVLPNPFTRKALAGLLDRAANGTFLGADALSAQRESTTYPNFAGVHVLAADDNAVNREVLREALSTLGVKVDFAEDGAEAVRKSTERNYDAIFMDGSMPVMDGFEATRNIRAREVSRGLPCTPIIALTAQVVGSGADAWAKAGADDMVTKPFSLERLARALSALVEQSSSKVQTMPGPVAAANVINAENLLDDQTVAGLAALGERSGRDLQTRVWALFKTKAPDGLAEFSSAQDTDNLARKAHALKSMALSAGAKAFANCCEKIERAAKTKASQAELGVLVEAATACLESTLAVMFQDAA